MTKLLPKPRLSILLFAIWVTVQMSFSPGNVIMGIILGMLIPLYTTRFWPDAPKVKNFTLLGRYLVIFLYDVLIANVQVAAWIVGPQEKLNSRFLYIPLDVTHPFTITVFASTISLTPGTVSSHISGDRKLLIVHCLHTDDPEQTVAEIKERYEEPLKEIFE